jgi:hypothetical protein
VTRTIPHDTTMGFTAEARRTKPLPDRPPKTLYAFSAPFSLLRVSAVR